MEKLNTNNHLLKNAVSDSSGSFMQELKLEWCQSKEQHKSFERDLLKFCKIINSEIDKEVKTPMYNILETVNNRSLNGIRTVFNKHEIDFWLQKEKYFFNKI
jgi:hypothetical protein